MFNDTQKTSIGALLEKIEKAERTIAVEKSYISTYRERISASFSKEMMERDAITNYLQQNGLLDFKKRLDKAKEDYIADWNEYKKLETKIEKRKITDILKPKELRAHLSEIKRKKDMKSDLMKRYNDFTEKDIIIDKATERAKQKFKKEYKKYPDPQKLENLKKYEEFLKKQEINLKKLQKSCSGLDPSTQIQLPEGGNYLETLQNQLKNMERKNVELNPLPIKNKNQNELKKQFKALQVGIETKKNEMGLGKNFGKNNQTIERN